MKKWITCWRKSARVDGVLTFEGGPVFINTDHAIAIEPITQGVLLVSIVRDGVSVGFVTPGLAEEFETLLAKRD